jgi:NAD(P)-dependent dehydrogenase (short-subunit alcohol dehydrogenase family)
VVIAGRRQEKLDEVIASTHEFNKGSTKVVGVRTDVKIKSDVDHLFQTVNATFGRPADVVYANAGWVSELIPSAEESVETWWSVYVSGDIVRWFRACRLTRDRRSTSWASTTPHGPGSRVSPIPKSPSEPSSTSTRVSLGT